MTFEVINKVTTNTLASFSTREEAQSLVDELADQELIVVAFNTKGHAVAAFDDEDH